MIVKLQTARATWPNLGKNHAIRTTGEMCGLSEPGERRLRTWVSGTELNSSTACCAHCAN